MVATKLMTGAELAAMPDDGFRTYLIRGELRRLPPPKLGHGIVNARMAFPFHLLAEEGLGVVVLEGGFLLRHDPVTVVAPDAAFILNEDLPPPGQWDYTAYICVPTAVIEVVSPSNTHKDVMEKVHEYLETGVKLILVAFPETKTVLVDGAGREPIILTEHDVLDGGDVLPTMRPLSVSSIFRQPLEI